MRKYKHFLAMAVTVALLAAMCLGVTALAESEPVQVVDDAGLLSPSEEQDIAGQVEKLEKSVKWDIMVVSTADAEGMSATEYAEQWFEQHTTRGDGVICLIDMDNRESIIRTYGQAIYYLTDDRIDKILDDAVAKVSKEDYHGAYTSMLEGVKSAYQRGIPDDQYTYDENTGKILGYYRDWKRITLGEAILAVVAALAAGGITIAAVIGKYRMKWGGYQYSYRENSHVELAKQNDRFVNQVVTHRRIPRQDENHGGRSGGGRSGGSRSTTHVSSGGRRSGGGSRKF